MTAPCGTDSGYHRHRRVTKTPPCDACRAAHSAADRKRRINQTTGRPTGVVACQDCGAPSHGARCRDCYLRNVRQEQIKWQKVGLIYRAVKVA